MCIAIIIGTNKIIIYETFFRINDLQALLKTKQNYTEFLEETAKEDIPLPLKIKSNVRST